MLFDVLTERQRREGWNDEQLAREIGISRPYLSLMRSGHKPVSLNTLRKVIKRFPEYTDLAVFFLHTDVSNTNISRPSHELAGKETVDAVA